ncbi:MAG: protein kinase [Acidobacteria bacterium]|nr:protein kinase [Acidobacteriota bacterium]
MNSDRWQQVKEVLDAALKRPPEERVRFLDEACQNDSELRGEVETFLSSFGDAESFLEKPAVGEVAEAIVNQEDKLTSGQSFGHYKVIEQIGAGGMGEVYLAQDTRLHRQVALKVLPENIASDKERLRRFEQAKLTEKTPLDEEAETIAQVQTQSGMILGTARYMSPEQARGKEIDERTDIFSFGVMLYEMSAGKLPFEGENAIDTISSILHKEPAPLSETETPRELQHIVEKCLRKDREERYQTTKDLLIDLKDVKQNLEFQNKFERTSAPQKSEKEAMNKVAAVTEIQNPQTTSSAEYIITEIRRNKSAFIPALVILLLVIGGLGAWFFSNRISNASQIESIAVLPFVNESGNGDVEYLSDGMTESLISSLSQLPKLNVKARNSVFRYKGKDTSPQQIGNELNVQAILTGRVVQRGDDLTLYLSLIDSKTENQIWGKQYNRKLTNLVVLQTEIARDVSDNLRTKLSGADEQRLVKNYTENAEAYQLYLKGRFHFNRFTEEGFKKSIEYYQQAIDIDDNYALAYSGLSDAYNVLGINGHMPVREAMPKVKSAAEKAVALDDQLPQARLALGAFKYFYEWDLNGAEAEFKRAMELDPGYAVPHELYGYLLRSRGEFDAALAELRKAQELDPLSLLFNGDIGETLRFAGRTAEAIEANKKSLEMDPNFADAHYTLALAYAEYGMQREAVAAINRAIELSDNSTHIKAALGQIYAMAGKKSEAYKVIDELLSQERYVSPLDIAMIYARLGENDKAFIWLEKAYDERAGWLIELKTEPAWEKIRSDARFQDLLRRVGLEK